MGKAHEAGNHASGDLRREAERRVQSRTMGLPEVPSEELLHELEVHQIELQMQNEALRIAQQELELSRDRYADLYDFAPVGYLTLTAQGAIRELNLTAAGMLGVERTLLLGRPLAMRISPQDRPVLRRHLGDCMATSDEEWTCEVGLRTPGVPPRVVELRSRCWQDHQDGPVCRTAMTDITLRKQAEQQLQQMNDSLEQQVGERTKLLWQRTLELQSLARRLTEAEHRERRRLAKLLHDHLQQLLVAARISTSTARRRTEQEEVRKLLERIDELINDSIDASRSLTRDLCPPVLHDVGLLGALAWLARSMREKHELAVEVSSSPGVEPDDQEMKVLVFEAVREALFNVVKHAGVAEAKVRVARTEQEEIRVDVIDEGTGFNTALLAGDRENSGFGLFSNRHRLELIGGCFDIHSVPGEGTRVTITVPAGEPEDAEDEETAAARSRASRRAQSGGFGPRPIRILLADDHEIVRHGLASMLMDEPDIEVIGEARDGQEAVEMARQICPDVILMDITMPQLDGIEATRRITAELPDIRVIGLSMHETADLARAMHEAGASAYCSKNGCSEELLRTIRGESG